MWLVAFCVTALDGSFTDGNAVPEAVTLGAARASAADDAEDAPKNLPPFFASRSAKYCRRFVSKSRSNR